MAETHKTNGNIPSPTEPIEDDEVIHSPPASETYEQVEDILEKVENYNPTIPDAVTENILQSAGFESASPEITRLVSLVAQKFISDISYEALQHCKMRGGGKEEKKKASGRDRKYAMTTEDLVVALSDQGLTVKKPPYYAN
jgi:transcription initiation factor TFIID subunit 10